MSKNLTSLVVAGLLANGCIITTGGTVSDSDSSTSDTTSTSGSTSGSTGGSTGGTDSGSTSDQPTTGGPTSSSGSTSGSTGGSNYGNCGWNADNKYYGCDGTPGASDPDGISPIDCPMELPMVGDKCDETTPVNNVGCCLPDGSNYYCDADGMVQIDMCG